MPCQINVSFNRTYLKKKSSQIYSHFRKQSLLICKKMTSLYTTLKEKAECNLCCVPFLESYVLKTVDLNFLMVQEVPTIFSQKQMPVTSSQNNSMKCKQKSCIYFLLWVLLNFVPFCEQPFALLIGAPPVRWSGFWFVSLTLNDS